jgi:hypothetical protein
MWLCLGAMGDRCQGPYHHLQSADEYGVEVLLDWAERTYPTLFPGPAATQWLAPYQYRYYPATGNHLGVSGGDVYVLGPISQHTIQRVGSVDDFRCLVTRCGAPPRVRSGALIGPR